MLQFFDGYREWKLLQFMRIKEVYNRNQDDVIGDISSGFIHGKQEYMIKTRKSKIEIALKKIS